MDSQRQVGRLGRIAIFHYLGIFGSFLLILFLGIAVLLGNMLESQKEKEDKEKASQNISGYTINGGVINNPRSNYKDNELPKEFKILYENIAKKYGIDWQLLAAIHRVETGFSSNVAVSSAGAVGHTQFMKCTWAGWGYTGCMGGLGNANIPENIYTDPKMIAKYNGEGVDGNGNGKANPLEISDSLSATAKKLEKDGANSNPEKAVITYNHSQDYVNDVMRHYNAYKSNAVWVVAGIKNVSDLGKQSSRAYDNGKGFKLDGSLPKILSPKSYEYQPTYPWGQCTWYVHQRRKQIGKDVGLMMGNGGDWDTNARAQGFAVGKVPKVGAAVSMPHGSFGSTLTYGHIAFVEKVNSDGSFIVSESNVKGLGVISFRSFTKGEGNQMDFIYDKK
ncbi:CHAP domain-containing protein [Macrococcoides caseolyticum]|uniref:lytic transglycosylase domain-containing protein n=1 Tax=Macrococcoides caseolyticum TaxID=69966 RepID=UPI0018E3C446|nr:lytic transglycosylase domain-containing protein [Macrococcus caseolyticus]